MLYERALPYDLQCMIFCLDHIWLCWIGLYGLVVQRVLLYGVVLDWVPLYDAVL